MVVTEFATADDARAFTRSAELKAAQQRAGMTAPPDFLVCEEVETDTY